MNVAANDIRHDWELDEVRAVYDMPLLDLVYRAATVHRRYHDPRKVQRCSLLSIKTGGCPEDCSYCPQSARFETPVDREPLMAVETVLAAARRARDAGATRFCMGAAWRSAKSGRPFEQVLQMVRGVRDLQMEACVTLGMLTDEQARALAEAGLTAYNHNLDTSEEFYSEVITTRTYKDRLETLQRVRSAGVSVCCGGIVGMGEAAVDRCSMLLTLAGFDPHPESVPVNLLVRVPGTPLHAEEPPAVEPLELVRTVATARILMPKSRVRLSAGRESLTAEAQGLCFMAGANSIFFGDKLLTTPNPDIGSDETLLGSLGLTSA